MWDAMQCGKWECGLWDAMQYGKWEYGLRDENIPPDHAVEVGPPYPPIFPQL